MAIPDQEWPRTFTTLQAGRGIAALHVLLFHAAGVIALPKYFGSARLERLFLFGDAGVDFFFVLSGFIIVWVHYGDAGRPARLPPYLVRRFVRIYPTYWAVFLAVFGLALAVPALRAQMPTNWGSIAKSLALLPQDPARVGGTGAPVIVVAWSLQYEIVFYVLFAALVVEPRLLAVICIALAWNHFACLGRCAFPGSFFDASWLLLFAFGAGIAWYLRRGGYLRRPMAVGAASLGLYIALVAAEIASHREVWASVQAIDRSIAYGVASMGMVGAMVCLEQAGVAIVRSRFLLLLGDSSYLLYLIHFPVISVMAKAGASIGLRGDIGAIACFIATVGVAVGCALFLHLGVERAALQFVGSRLLATMAGPKA